MEWASLNFLDRLSRCRLPCTLTLIVVGRPQPCSQGLDLLWRLLVKQAASFLQHIWRQEAHLNWLGLCAVVNLALHLSYHCAALCQQLLVVLCVVAIIVNVYPVCMVGIFEAAIRQIVKLVIFEAYQHELFANQFNKVSRACETNMFESKFGALTIFADLWALLRCMHFNQLIRSQIN